jgi:hypothetical protein
LGDRAFHITVTLSGEGDLDYFPQPEIYLFGPRHPGTSRYRRRSDAVIGFGNRKAFRGHNTLPSGRILDEEFVVQLLKQVCQCSQPLSLYLINEECVSIPLNYHFVFHNNLKGFARDLDEIVRIILHGGKGFGDARDDYKSPLAEEPTMLFCKRSGDYLVSLKEFITVHGSRLEVMGMPDSLERNCIEDALLASDNLEFFFADEGLGIYSKPLMASYCEDLYLEVMARSGHDQQSL